MSFRRIALTVAGLAAVVSTALPAGVAGAAPTAPVAGADVCGPVGVGFARCYARVSPAAGAAHATAAAAVTATGPAGYHPADLQAAYRLDPTLGAGRTVAIVDAFHNPRAEADLATYRSTFGLPACTTANGCFRQVNRAGNTSPMPKTDSNWAIEISLDVQMVSAVCPNCKILLVEAWNNSFGELALAHDYAAANADYISNSYGGTEEGWLVKYLAPHFNRPGKVVTASTGDAGHDGGRQVPASLSGVVAVGGTTLVRNTAVVRGFAESAWSGAGSACSGVVAKPAFQNAANTGCAKRAVADISAVADPGTGVSVFDTFVFGGWVVLGGTSAASPIIAAAWALAGTAGGVTDASRIYANKAKLFDVTAGSNGTCGVPLCKARAGWDGPTGNGTPNGLAVFG